MYRHMHMHSCAFSHTHREVDRKRRDLLAAIRAAVDRKREHARLVREAEVVCVCVRERERDRERCMSVFLYV